MEGQEGLDIKGLIFYNLDMIYYVEDDENIRELAVYALEKAQLETRGFADGAAFFEACAQQTPDCVLLDIMLPGMNGLEILQHIRHDPHLGKVPVLMLTAKGTELDKVRGLDAGADDYLAKPFGMMELTSRVNALMRRAQMNASESHSTLGLGSIQIDRDARTVSVAGRPCPLTMKEFDLLTLLVTNAGRVLTREQIMQSVWDTDFVGATRTVDVHVLSLRQKLESANPEAKAHGYIRTVRGIGYKAVNNE